MLFERIEATGLAHFSYLIGDGHEAVVIDPRRDVDIYIEKAQKAGMQITNILETHRNEDYVIGSIDLMDRTGAAIFHSDYEDYDFEFGTTIKDDDLITLGNLKIKAIHTPGHTKGHMSYLLYDSDGNPWMIFTGDALFAGDVGRTDFYQGELQEMTGELYDSIFNKILPLGDEIIVCPAHGAGSVCGNSITERVWTTIGLERKYNTALQCDSKSEFIEKNATVLEYPPYFKEMERLNKIGSEVSCSVPVPVPLSAHEFIESADECQILDIRSETSYSAAHIPGSIFISEDTISNFAGWFLNYDKPILLVSDSQELDSAIRHLYRIGFDSIKGYLKGGMTAAGKAGMKTKAIAIVDAVDVKEIHENGKDPFILDIRDATEAAGSKLPTNLRIHLTMLSDNLDKIPSDRKIFIFCGSGIRSMIAASILENAEYDNLAVVLGGTSGWKSV